jgi:exodeoxyribonuclease V alpha subunit
VSVLPEVDPLDARFALRAGGLLAEFNAAGVLGAADVHVARTLGELSGVTEEEVLLAAALAVRGPRLGHVRVDLTTVRETVAVDTDETLDLAALPWPEPEGWLPRVAASRLVADGEDAPESDRPLRLSGTALYLDRYWREERRIARELLARSATRPDVDADVLESGLRRLFGRDEEDLQRLAAAAAVRSRFAVVAGGPGTGKTTTVARILVLLDEQAAAAGRPPPRVALAAPTGKAAARLEEAVHAEAAGMPIDEGQRARLVAHNGSTLHRLLGWRVGGRIRHNRDNKLPHDVVVVDEASMVSLSAMARVVDAARSDARLILVGDPDQLASVEAGAVLGDIVGPATGPTPPQAAVGNGIVVLRRVHRFGGAIAELASAIRRGDDGRAVAVLRAGQDDVRWIDLDVAAGEAGGALQPVRTAVVDAGRRISDAAHIGDARTALDALGAMRVLCAHRRGPYGVVDWTAQIERWLSAAIAGYADGGTWYAGRPLLVTENDYSLKLYNGDTGIVVGTGRDGTVAAVFDRAGGLLEISPRRLASVDTVHAMTIHKSQGSQFDAVATILPDSESPILTRELLYTAVTRARQRLTVVGTEASVRAAVLRPIARASGLRERLWTAPSPPAS